MYKADRFFDRIPIHFKNILMYVDPITRQTYDYAAPITCNDNPQNIIELDLNSDDQEFYIFRPEPLKQKPPLMFTPSQSKITKRPNTFTAQDAGVFSNAELEQFWNRIFFSKHSDKTLQSLGNALSYSYISVKTPDYSDSHTSQTNPFISLIGYPCYILTQCGVYVRHFFSYKLLLYFSLNSIKHFQTNLISNKVSLFLVQKPMVV